MSPLVSFLPSFLILSFQPTPFFLFHIIIVIPCIALPFLLACIFFFHLFTFFSSQSTLPYSRVIPFLRFTILIHVSSLIPLTFSASFPVVNFSLNPPPIILSHPFPLFYYFNSCFLFSHILFLSPLLTFLLTHLLLS